LKADPRPHGVEKLTDTDNLHRVRAGSFRIIYQIRDEVLLVTIVKVAPRNEAYR
jgi:mRNA interferase RelE/StbE